MRGIALALSLAMVTIACSSSGGVASGDTGADSAIATETGAETRDDTTTPSDTGSETVIDASGAVQGGAHFEIVSDPAVTDPTLKCDDIGVQKDIASTDASGVKKLLVDGVDGASVTCKLDASHFAVSVADALGDFLSASGTISGDKSTDADVVIGFLGSKYANPAGTKCTVTFVCTVAGGCSGGSITGDGSLEGHFVCTEVDNDRTAKECALTGTNPAGFSNSFFKFLNCTGF
jgi:hypothetical protein